MSAAKEWTYHDVLRRARARLPEPMYPRFEAEELLAKACGKPRNWFLTRWKELCPGKDEAAFFDLVERRVSGEPLQFLLGEWEFLGRTFRVDDRALIPRGETERIVEASSEIAPRARRILDLGTGSGILAVSLAIERPEARIVALDISLEALALARSNAHLFSVQNRIAFAASNWMSGVLPPEPDRLFDLAVANPPYVPLADAPHIDKTVSEHEPSVALYGGDDGLDPLRVLLSSLAPFLCQGAFFIFEFGYGQAREVSNLVEGAKEFELIDIRLDHAGIPRTGIARRV